MNGLPHKICRVMSANTFNCHPARTVKVGEFGLFFLQTFRFLFALWGQDCIGTFLYEAPKNIGITGRSLWPINDGGGMRDS